MHCKTQRETDFRVPERNNRLVFTGTTVMHKVMKYWFI